MINDQTAAIFDCTVFLQAATSPGGPSFTCLELAEQGLFRLLISAEILAEVADVLNRPHLRSRFERLTEELADQFLKRLARTAETVGEVPAVFQYARDPKDEPYLNLAIASAADFLVARDRDLLDLRNPATPDGKRLRAHAPSLTIVSPVEFLRSMPTTRRD